MHNDVYAYIHLSVHTHVRTYMCIYVITLRSCARFTSWLGMSLIRIPRNCFICDIEGASLCWMWGFQPQTIGKITQSTRFQDWMIHDSWLKKQRVHSAQPIRLDQLCWFDNKIMKKQRNWWLYNGIMRHCKIKDQENRGV
jgi:hypothetical protein